MATGTATVKGVVGIYQPGSTHMVGDGFPVRNLFPSNDLDRLVDPFLMLDYAGPHVFEPSAHPRGVGEHPHRGFETVTIMYQGAVAHRDSAGNAGVIRPGDVQWMTAASGVVHEEMHETDWAKKGGIFQVVQLWVNLPRSQKMSAPRYQTILDADIPAVDLNGGGTVRVISGSFQGRKGPARTHTPVDLYDLQLQTDEETEVNVQDGHHMAILVVGGRVSVNRSAEVKEGELVVFSPHGNLVKIDADTGSRLLIMSGQPLNEPIARYGPFVMNTRDELVQAAQDYQAGRMGHLS